MVVHYLRTAWKNSYAEHKVAGKIYNYKKNTPWGNCVPIATEMCELGAEHTFEHWLICKITDSIPTVYKWLLLIQSKLFSYKVMRK